MTAMRMGRRSLAALPEPAPGQRERGSADDRASLGRTLKGMRLERRLTLDAAAKLTGVARSTLSKVENGQMSPTYDVLQKITRGLDLDLVALFDPKPQAAVSGRRSITRAGAGPRHVTPAYEYEILASDISRKRMLAFRATIRARSLDDFPDWVRHEGEEFICVLSGEVEVHTEHYAPVILRPGDSLYFDSEMGHACLSRGPEDAQVLWTCTGTTQGSGDGRATPRVAIGPVLPEDR